MGHRRPLEVIQLVIIGESMEDGKVVLLDEVTEKVTLNLNGIQVRFDINNRIQSDMIPPCICGLLGDNSFYALLVKFLIIFHILFYFLCDTL